MKQAQPEEIAYVAMGTHFQELDHAHISSEYMGSDCQLSLS